MIGYYKLLINSDLHFYVAGYNPTNANDGMAISYGTSFCVYDCNIDKALLFSHRDESDDVWEYGVYCRGRIDEFLASHEQKEAIVHELS